MALVLLFLLSEGKPPQATPSHLPLDPVSESLSTEKKVSITQKGRKPLALLSPKIWIPGWDFFFVTASLCNWSLCLSLPLLWAAADAVARTTGRIRMMPPGLSHCARLSSSSICISNNSCSHLDSCSLSPFVSHQLQTGTKNANVKGKQCTILPVLYQDLMLLWDGDSDCWLV